MRAKRFLGLTLVLLLIGVGLYGCEQSKSQVAYNTLLTSQGVYQAAWGAFKDLYDEAIIDEDTFMKGRKYAIDYYNAWMFAADSAMAYQEYVDKKEMVPDDVKRALEVAMNNFKPVSDAFFSFVKPIIERSRS